MKKHLLLWLTCLPLCIAAQQTYTWNVSSGSWTTASNWSPQRTTPDATDILEFNFTATVSGTPASESVGKIRIYNNATLFLSSTATSSITLGHNTVTAPHLAIEVGSSMHITGSNAVIIAIDAGFTGQVDGSIDFSQTAHRLTAATADALVFTNGSVFTANSGFAGNAFGTTNNNSVVFQSGATYILKDGGNPFGAAAPDAVAVFNAGSIYRHQVNGTGPSFAGRTYGNVFIEANVNFAGIGSARDCIIQNDLSVFSGFFSFKPNTLGSHSGNFKIFGNVSASGSSIIDVGSPNMPGAVQLLGTNQAIGSGGGTGTITFQHFTVNNSTTTLQRNLTVTGTLNLTGGKIISSAPALLILSATGSIQGCAHDYFNLPYSNIGCDNAYVEGPVKKLGLLNSDFSFPIGVNGKLRPAFLRNASGDFTVEFIRGDPYLLSNVMGVGIHHISHLEYWNVTATGSAGVELTYFDPNSGGVTDMNALRIVRYNGAEWESVDVNTFLGSPGANGSITSNSVNTFGSFTLAGSSDYPNNPLPIKLIKWDGLVQGQHILLQWQTEDESTYKSYTVEKSWNGIDFYTLGTPIEKQSVANQVYKINDPISLPGTCYYRLKITGVNNQFNYSKTVSIKIAGEEKLIVYPNPAHEKIFIKIPTTSSISRIAIVHISGSVIEWLTSANQTTVSVNINHLSPGVYFLKIIQPESVSFVPFVKY
jgi:hypothetical protein